MKLAILVLLAACGGKMPETRFYQLATPASQPSQGSGTSGVPLVIEAIETDTAYDDERIVYRVTPFRLDYYSYHRWSAAPGVMIGNFLEHAFESSGKFRTVTREPNVNAPVTLRGRVLAIEEVDKSKTEWVGRIVLELTLVDSTSTDVLWTEQYEELERLPVQTPEGLARALTIAVKRIADRAVPVVATFAVQHARSTEPAKATNSRAARLRQ